MGRRACSQICRFPWASSPHCCAAQPSPPSVVVAFPHRLMLPKQICVAYPPPLPISSMFLRRILAGSAAGSSRPLEETTKGSSLTTAPPVASNGGCPHSHRLGGAPLGSGQAQDNSDGEGRGHRWYPSHRRPGSSALADHPDCSGFFLAYQSLTTARYHPPLNPMVPSQFVGCRVIHCDLALIR
jgi:hypothetical protein